MKVYHDGLNNTYYVLSFNERAKIKDKHTTLVSTAFTEKYPRGVSWDNEDMFALNLIRRYFSKTDGGECADIDSADICILDRMVSHLINDSNATFYLLFELSFEYNQGSIVTLSQPEMEAILELRGDLEKDVQLLNYIMHAHPQCTI